jgi:hypothetical protein
MMIDAKCQKCRYHGKCLYENAEVYGIKASDCCEVQ